jgi:hypothetical protein
MTTSNNDASVALTSGEREYIRRELDSYFGSPDDLFKTAR